MQVVSLLLTVFVALAMAGPGPVKDWSKSDSMKKMKTAEINSNAHNRFDRRVTTSYAMMKSYFFWTDRHTLISLAFNADINDHSDTTQMYADIRETNKNFSKLSQVSKSRCRAFEGREFPIVKWIENTDMISKLYLFCVGESPLGTTRIFGSPESENASWVETTFNGLIIPESSQICSNSAEGTSYLLVRAINKTLYLVHEEPRWITPIAEKVIKFHCRPRDFLFLTTNQTLYSGHISGKRGKLANKKLFTEILEVYPPAGPNQERIYVKKRHGLLRANCSLYVSTDEIKLKSVFMPLIGMHQDYQFYGSYGNHTFFVIPSGQANLGFNQYRESKYADGDLYRSNAQGDDFHLSMRHFVPLLPNRHALIPSARLEQRSLKQSSTTGLTDIGNLASRSIFVGTQNPSTEEKNQFEMFFITHGALGTGLLPRFVISYDQGSTWSSFDTLGQVLQECLDFVSKSFIGQGQADDYEHSLNLTARYCNLHPKVEPYTSRKNPGLLLMNHGFRFKKGAEIMSFYPPSILPNKSFLVSRDFGKTWHMIDLEFIQDCVIVDSYDGLIICLVSSRVDTTHEFQIIKTNLTIKFSLDFGQTWRNGPNISWDGDSFLPETLTMKSHEEKLFIGSGRNYIYTLDLRQETYFQAWKTCDSQHDTELFSTKEPLTDQDTDTANFSIAYRLHPMSYSVFDFKQNSQLTSCMMGEAFELKRRKSQANCRMNFTGVSSNTVRSEACQCTEADYDCNSGFFRAVDQSHCFVNIEYLDFVISHPMDTQVPYMPYMNGLNKHPEFLPPDLDSMISALEKNPDSKCFGGFSPQINESLMDRIPTKNMNLTDSNWDELVDGNSMGNVKLFEEWLEKRLMDKHKESHHGSLIIVLCLLILVIVVGLVLMKTNLLGRIKATMEQTRFPQFGLNKNSNSGTNRLISEDSNAFKFSPFSNEMATTNPYNI